MLIRSQTVIYIVNIAYLPLQELARVLLKNHFRLVIIVPCKCDYIPFPHCIKITRAKYPYRRFLMFPLGYPWLFLVFPGYPWLSLQMMQIIMICEITETLDICKKNIWCKELKKWNLKKRWIYMQISKVIEGHKWALYT